MNKIKLHANGVHKFFLVKIREISEVKSGRVQNFTSIVVVLEATNDACMIRNPKTLKEKARFKTAGNPTVL